MFNSEKVAKSIAATLRRNGVKVAIDSSALSASRYLTASTDDDGLRIRVSDHVAKPSYERLNGPADYEVGTHDMAVTKSASIAAAAIMDRLGVAYSKKAVLAPAKAAETRKANQEADLAAWKAHRDACVAKWITENVPNYEGLKSSHKFKVRMQAMDETIDQWKK